MIIDYLYTFNDFRTILSVKDTVVNINNKFRKHYYVEEVNNAHT